MKTILSRRSFVRASSAGLAATALAPSMWARAAPQVAPVLVLVFLRGGADGLSLAIPRSGYGRQKYDLWRPSSGAIHVPASTSASASRGLPIGASLDTHPAMAQLVSGASSPFALGHLAFVAGVAGAVENRSHFMQMDLIESGASSGVPLSTGYLARTLDALGLQEEPLAGVAMNPTVPFSLQGTTSRGISIPDFQGFGTLTSASYATDPEWGLHERLTTINATATCSTTVATCAAAGLAAGAMEEVEALGLIGTPAGDLQQTLLQLSEVIATADSGQLRVVTLDVGGWDTHTNQADTLDGQLGMLASALRAFHDDLVVRGILDRVTLVVHAEFGRRADENGTEGTDHGYGGTALVLDSHLVSNVVASGYFPNNANHAFYDGIENEGTDQETFVLPKVMDVRRVVGEALRFRLGVTDAALGQGAAAIFPGYSIPNGSNQVLSAV